MADDELTILGEEELPPPGATRCAGRRPLPVRPHIMQPTDRWRIARVGFWIGAVLLALILFSRALFAQQNADGFQTLRRLPQRTQEVLSIIALQAEVSRVGALSFEEGGQKGFPAITRRTSGRDVVRELAPWMRDHASDELNAVFGMVDASEDAFTLWFYHLMDAASANNYGLSEEQLADVTWIARRIRLVSGQSAVLWDILLWGLLNELTSDPLERVALWDDAVTMAELQFDQPQPTPPSAPTSLPPTAQRAPVLSRPRPPDRNLLKSLMERAADYRVRRADAEARLAHAEDLQAERPRPATQANPWAPAFDGAQRAAGSLLARRIRSEISNLDREWRGFLSDKLGNAPTPQDFDARANALGLTDRELAPFLELFRARQQ